MSYILKVGDQNISVPLNKPVQLWAKKEFNPKLPLVMMVTGWTTNFNDTKNNALDVIYAAYRCRGNVNFVVSGFLFLRTTLFQSTFSLYSYLTFHFFFVFCSFAVRLLIQVSFPINLFPTISFFSEINTWVNANFFHNSWLCRYSVLVERTQHWGNWKSYFRFLGALDKNISHQEDSFDW